MKVMQTVLHKSYLSLLTSRDILEVLLALTSNLNFDHRLELCESANKHHVGNTYEVENDRHLYKVCAKGYSAILKMLFKVVDLNGYYNPQPEPEP